jgi:flavin reductase (DIM6/NTAB) family NADH-FMN oxidoreductase RutF
MEKVKWKGSALLAPVPPALVSCGTMEKPNIITVAWTGIINSSPPKTYVSIRQSRLSHEIIKSTKEFVINLTTAELVRAADYCGVKSGRDTDKFKDCSLSAQQSSEVSAPMIGESPLSLECRVTDIIPLGSHDMFLADIIAVNVSAELIDREGKLHLEKCGLAAFAHGDYFKLGKKIGSFGFSVRKKKKGTGRRK